jgi:diaminopimelate epimerase
MKIDGKNSNHVPFVKMHGAGNDYVYIICIEHMPDDLPGLAREISDRHFGVGGDGLVAICRSDVGDFKMRMFNNDGSEAQMCGNASRCIAKLVYEKGLTDKREILLETKAGIKTLIVNTDDKNKVESVTVNMGAPIFEPERIPVTAHHALESIRISSANNNYDFIAVSMGNPHAVCFINNITDENVLIDGKQIECNPIFPEKTNVEFAQILDRTHIRMRVWERGSGETMACGTGACAVTAAAIALGLSDNTVEISLLGGNLEITQNKSGEIFMTGGAEIVAEGIYFPKN